MIHDCLMKCVDQTHARHFYFLKGSINKSRFLYERMRFCEVCALSWCQEKKKKKNLAETPIDCVCLYAYLNMFWLTRKTHTHTHSEIIYFHRNLMRFVIHVGEPRCLCTSRLPACPPAHLLVCMTPYLRTISLPVC